MGVVNYLDDFILFGVSFDQCQYFQPVLIDLLGSLGFRVAWSKCSTPLNRSRYLGVIFDSESLELWLPDEKLGALRAELLYFKDKERATRHQLQRLCGLIAHASKLVRSGRNFSRRLIDKLNGLEHKNRICLGAEFRKDINRWLQLATQFNGVSRVIFYHSYDVSIYTDA